MTELLRDAAAAALDNLSERLDGDLYRPGDADWDEARTAWNLAVDQQPAAVVVAESAADVAHTVRAARVEGLRVAPQGTGHAAAAIGDLTGTILLRTTRMRGVDVDPQDRRARVEAGVIWQEVTDAAAEHGLAALAGSSHDVGVFGYSLGGGLSWLARKHGLAANTILAAEIVDANGAIRRIDADSDPELFWAIRGGGGSFAIVTAIELRLFPIEEVVAGVLFFPLERASEVLNAWLEWTTEAPEDVTSCGRIMRFPPFPEVPEPLRGKAFALVEAVFAGEPAAADDSSLRSARSDRRWTRSASCLPASSARCTWTRRTRSPASATGSCSARPTPTRSPHSSSRRARSRGRRSSPSSYGSSAVRSTGRRRVTARRRSPAASTPSSRSGSRRRRSSTRRASATRSVSSKRSSAGMRAGTT